MKKNIVSVLVASVMAVSLFVVSSCDKGGDHHPTIVFKPSNTVVNYLSKDTTFYRGTIFNVGINASKTGPDGMLKSFKITKSINGGADSVLVNAELYTRYFSQFYSYAAGDSGNIEHYTFTVGNTEGLFNSIAFTDTVN